MTSERYGANEFEIISFVENGVGSKIYDVVQKRKGRKFNMEVAARKPLHNEITNTKLKKHKTEEKPFLVCLKYSFQTKSRNYIILTHHNQCTSFVSMLSNDVVLDEDEVRFILAELVVALSSLHSMAVSYNGVSMKDISFDNSGHVLLRRTFYGQTYWSKDEIPVFDQHNRVTKKPSADDKKNDWLSLSRLLVTLSTNENCRQQNLGLHTMSKAATDFALNSTYGKDCEVSIKTHPFFAKINWDEVKNKQLAVPNRIVHFVTESLKINRDIKPVNIEKTTETLFSTYQRPSAMRRSSESFEITDRVEGIRKSRRFLNRSVSGFAHCLEPVSQPAVSRTLSAGSIFLKSYSNGISPPPEITGLSFNRRSSIELYRKRLDEITKVLDNNKNMMENFKKKDAVTDSAAFPSNHDDVHKQKKVTNKIYAENDLIRNILSKYGLLRDNVVSMSQCNNVVSASQSNNVLPTSQSGNVVSTSQSNDVVLTSRSHNSVVPTSRSHDNKEDTRNSTNLKQIKHTDRAPTKLPNKPNGVLSPQIQLNGADLAKDGDEIQGLVLNVKAKLFQNEKLQTKEAPQNDTTELEIADKHEARVHAGNNEEHETDEGSKISAVTPPKKTSIAGILMNKLNDISTKNSHKNKALQQFNSQVIRHNSEITVARHSTIRRERGYTLPINLHRSSTAPAVTHTKYSSGSRSFEDINWIQDSTSVCDEYNSHLHTEDDGFNEDRASWPQEQEDERENLARVWKPGKPNKQFLAEEELKMSLNTAENCDDCGKNISTETRQNENICLSCLRSRNERKEAIIELIETEVNYGNDLRILKEEFYAPIKGNGICTQDELSKVFLNLQELVDANSKLCTALKEGLQASLEQDDNDFIYLSVGEVFSNCVEFFDAYDVFCAQQRYSLELLENLIKKNDMLRIFLNVSREENNKLRKLDLKSFLVMPVQRIMKYPLLLHRIYKTTPKSNYDKQHIKEALNKIEKQIYNINLSSRKDDTSNWEIRPRASTSFLSLHNIDTSNKGDLKLVANLLNWKYEDTLLLLNDDFKLANEDLVGLTEWDMKNYKKHVQVILCVNGASDDFEREARKVDFNRIDCDVNEAMIIMLKKKSFEKRLLFKKPLDLKQLVTTNLGVSIAFQLTEMYGDTFALIANNETKRNVWISYLNFTLKCLKTKWRRRRYGMSNIMITTLV
ncbi:uncharacterized protein LOC130653941 [Hydractinia symbiolongicarpus]|uniref:uncharacterized protein LOC130653941 n=1 Tax=Hydractinia symbiolongicarpus TaxID=13093 RepID=UPI00254A387C|nr:uncharacterized protein LOC130653941 [Hydractinia symbiolongicarpus]